MGILWPVPMISTYDSCGPNTTTSASSTIALTEAKSLLTQAHKTSCCTSYRPEQITVPTSPATRIRMGLPLAARQLHRLPRPCSRNAVLSNRPNAVDISRINSDLHDLMDHVNCVHLRSVCVVTDGAHLYMLFEWVYCSHPPSVVWKFFSRQPKLVLTLLEC